MVQEADMPGWILALRAAPFSFIFARSEVRSVRKASREGGRSNRIYVISTIVKGVCAIGTVFLFAISYSLELDGERRVVWERYWHASVVVFIVGAIAAIIQYSPHRNKSRD
jgi:hypothetical protein